MPRSMDGRPLLPGASFPIVSASERADHIRMDHREEIQRLAFEIDLVGHPGRDVKSRGNVKGECSPQTLIYLTVREGDYDGRAGESDLFEEPSLACSDHCGLNPGFCLLLRVIDILGVAALEQVGNPDLVACQPQWP